MAEKTVAGPSGHPVATGRESTRAQERHILPPVDIYETSESLVLIADLPGVAKEDLELRVDNNVLTLQGKASHAVSGEAIYREYELVNFFRQFERKRSTKDVIDGNDRDRSVEDCRRSAVSTGGG